MLFIRVPPNFCRWAHTTRTENIIQKNTRYFQSHVVMKISRFKLHWKYLSEEDETRTHTTQRSLPPQSSASTNSATSPFNLTIQCSTGAQNRTRTCTSLNTRTWNERVYHSATWALSTRGCTHQKSGKRGSNSRPQPWQGCALPTELFPQFLRNCEIFCCARHKNKFFCSHWQRKFRNPCFFFETARFSAALGIRMNSSALTGNENSAISFSSDIHS